MSGKRLDLGRLIIPDRMRAMPLHMPAHDSIEMARLIFALSKMMDEPNQGPVYLWMPEWLNELVWHAWAWTRRIRGLPVSE